MKVDFMQLLATYVEDTRAERIRMNVERVSCSTDDPPEYPVRISIRHCVGGLQGISVCIHLVLPLGMQTCRLLRIGYFRSVAALELSILRVGQLLVVV